ncbi:FecR domain-containing protein [Chitinophaga niabensis]|uniref:FecR family protein n=1 Tax=Chitinophaga niabensis TaxID=536979 RepID=UPI0031BB46DD
MKREQIQYLLQQHLDGTITESESALLADALLEQEGTEALELALQEMAMGSEKDPSYKKEHWEDMISGILSTSASTKKRLLPIRFLQFAAAAMVLGIIATGLYFWNRTGEKSTVDTYAKNDVAPGGNKAVLILGDGSRVALDSSGNQVLRQGTIAIHQQGGQLQYDQQGTETSVSYNTLSTPRGGQFQIILPDGTKVWLNAASSLRYPTAFTGGERKVEITGEAYFEVVKNAAMPFRVKISKEATVEVLGTHFNINAYADEAAVRTTLLEGKIKVMDVVLNPGEQAQITTGIQINRHVDTSAVMAWRYGLFNFEGQNLKEVMRQLSRWYDIEVIYEGTVPDIVFGGKMLRNINLSQLLKVLEDAEVHFTLEEGRKLIISNQ